MGLLFGRADEDTIKESGICSYIVYIYTMKKVAIYFAFYIYVMAQNSGTIK